MTRPTPSPPSGVVEMDAMDGSEWEEGQATPQASDAKLAALVKESAPKPVEPVVARKTSTMARLAPAPNPLLPKTFGGKPSGAAPPRSAGPAPEPKRAMPAAQRADATPAPKRATQAMPAAQRADATPTPKRPVAAAAPVAQRADATPTPKRTTQAMPAIRARADVTPTPKSSAPSTASATSALLAAIGTAEATAPAKRGPVIGAPKPPTGASPSSAAPVPAVAEPWGDDLAIAQEESVTVRQPPQSEKEPARSLTAEPAALPPQPVVHRGSENPMPFAYAMTPIPAVEPVYVPQPAIVVPVRSAPPGTARPPDPVASPYPVVQREPAPVEELVAAPEVLATIEPALARKRPSRRAMALIAGGVGVLVVAIVVFASSGSHDQPTPAEPVTPPTAVVAPPVEIAAAAVTPPPAPAPASSAAAAAPVAPVGSRLPPPAATPTKVVAPVNRIATRPSNRLGGKRVVLEYDKPAPVPNVSGAPQPGEDSAVVNARASYAAGNQRLFNGDATGAITAYRESLHSYPGYVAGYRGLGLAYAQLGDKTKAMQSLRLYLAAVPKAKDAELIKKRIARLSAP